jgi:hypothetical protein
MPPPGTPNAQGHLWLAPSPPEIVETGSPVRAFLFALGAAALCGGAWVTIIVATNRIWFYAAFIIGLLAARAAERGWSVAGDTRAVVTAAATALDFGFRHLIANESDVDVPLWLGATQAIELLKIGLKAEPLVAVCSLAAVVIAGVKART